MRTTNNSGGLGAVVYLWHLQVALLVPFTAAEHARFRYHKVLPPDRSARAARPRGHANFKYQKVMSPGRSPRVALTQRDVCGGCLRPGGQLKVCRSLEAVYSNFY